MMSINKELFQFAGKKKTPDFLPNVIVGTKFGQGLPPVKVNWKKKGEIGRDINSIFSFAPEKLPFLAQFLS